MDYVCGNLTESTWVKFFLKKPYFLHHVYDGIKQIRGDIIVLFFFFLPFGRVRFFFHVPSLSIEKRDLFYRSAVVPCSRRQCHGLLRNWIPTGTDDVRANENGPGPGEWIIKIYRGKSTLCISDKSKIRRWVLWVPSTPGTFISTPGGRRRKIFNITKFSSAIVLGEEYFH